MNMTQNQFAAIFGSRPGGGEKLGPEMVVNGGFDTDTDWDKDAGVTITGGVAHCVNATNGSYALRQLGMVPLTIVTYRVTFTISNRTSGGILLNLGFTGGSTTYQANGTFTEDITTGGVAGHFYLNVNGGAFNGDIDNVSVKEIL